MTHQSSSDTHPDSVVEDAPDAAPDSPPTAQDDVPRTSEEDEVEDLSGVNDTSALLDPHDGDPRFSGPDGVIDESIDPRVN